MASRLGSFLAAGVLPLMAACGTIVETYSPTAAEVNGMSVDEAKAVLHDPKLPESLSYLDGTCPFCNVASVHLSDDGTKFVVTKTTGKTYSVNVSRHIQLEKSDDGESYLTIGGRSGYTFFSTGSAPISPKRIATALLVIELASAREQGLAQRQAQYQAAVERAVQTYSAANPKPVPGEDVRRFEVQAIDAVKQKRFADAVNLYGQALAIAPWWPAGHHDRALILAELGRNREAMAEMQDYLALVPNAADARAMQDKIYVWQGREAAGGTAGSATSNSVSAGTALQPSVPSAGGSLFQAITGGGK